MLNKLILIFVVFFSSLSYAAVVKQTLTTDAERKEASGLISMNFRCGYIAKYSGSNKLDMDVFFDAATKQQNLVLAYITKQKQNKPRANFYTKHKESWRQGVAKGIEDNLDKEAPIRDYFVKLIDHCEKLRIRNMLFFDGLGKEDLSNFFF